MSDIQFHRGDCRNVMALWPANSIDAFVLDPPYGLSDHDTVDVVECLTAWMADKPYLVRKKGGFMGQTWDSWVPGPEVWRECYRVLKPGGYLLCFASTRTDDLMSIAIRLSGFRKHPFIAWIFGQGFGKGTNLSKMIDKQAGAERKVVGFNARSKGIKPGSGNYGGGGAKYESGHDITAPATLESQQWDGWYYGLQTLKPAVEPILMFQKPADRTMTANVLEWGTGAINIDATRIPVDPTVDDPRLGGNGTWGTEKMAKSVYEGGYAGDRVTSSLLGRWPSNVVTDGSALVLQGFPVTTSGTGAVKRATAKGHQANAYGVESRPEGTPNIEYGDMGNASRFFYQAKASGLDRWFYCRDCAGAYLDSERDLHGHGHTDEAGKQTWDHVVSHPTVKPTSLLRWLVKLVTPPGGILVDPFVGSGSTLVAAELEGFNAIGIDIDPEYIAIAKARVTAVQLPLLALANG